MYSRVIAAGPLGKIKTVTQMAAVLLLLLLSPVTGEAPLGEGGNRGGRLSAGVF